MDQKRTLWILAAVGLFLLVVIGFAVIIYGQETKLTPSLAENNKTNDIWSSNQPDELIPDNKNDAEYIGIENLMPQEKSSITLAPEVEKENDSGKIKVDELTVISENTKFISNGQTIDLSNMVSPSQPAVTQSATPARNTAKAEVKEEKKVEVKPSPKPQAKNNSRAAAVNVAKNPAAKTVSMFWIQASAYSSKKNAEEARSALNAEKIPSEIFTYTDAKGKLFYRVRVGPYSTKTEAEYWQTRIKAMEKFADANCYITDSTAKAK
ncbi:MAG: SPOR domain-containing protein [Treponemataceae bacterium]|nr:SPOR domain-containing protein [Treponemataceae bacterium]